MLSKLMELFGILVAGASTATPTVKDGDMAQCSIVTSACSKTEDAKGQCGSATHATSVHPWHRLIAPFPGHLYL